MWLQRPPTSLYWKKGERALGYRYEMPHSPAAHYQWICPPCRRALLALAQGALWFPAGLGRPDESIPNGRASMPSYANPALGEGPLGEEDRNNFHP
jgi:hypothetical protein